MKRFLLTVALVFATIIASAQYRIVYNYVAYMDTVVEATTIVTFNRDYSVMRHDLESGMVKVYEIDTESATSRWYFDTKTGEKVYYTIFVAKLGLLPILFRATNEWMEMTYPDNGVLLLLKHKP